MTESDDEHQVADKSFEDHKVNGKIFIHQEGWQQQLLVKYGNIMTLSDGTYKTTKYSLPLFLLCVRKNRLGIFHGTEWNNLTELLRYKVRNGMAITWGVVLHALSSFTGLYTSCAPCISMNEYNITVSVLLLHSSFKNF